MIERTYRDQIMAILELFATTQPAVEGIPVLVEMIREENFEIVATVLEKLHEYKCEGKPWPDPLEWQELWDLEPMLT